MAWLGLLLSIALADPDPRVAVDTWTSRNGLPQNSVTDMAIDQDGYLWITTFGGIARFDGWRFDAYTPANTPSLRDARFTSVTETEDGSLWFGSVSGVLYRFRDGAFEVVSNAMAEVHDLARSPAGSLWIAATTGTWRLDDEELTRVDPRYARDLLMVSDAVVSRGDGELRCIAGDCGALDGTPLAYPSTSGGTVWGIRDGHYV
ncbi:MAG: hypothetical protein KC656_06225, partial [Myxococcales bacterium]|nr:hypothetical protein [Myxococcales bacterium]